MTTATIRTITATRYVTPLREGGSLPAIVEADDDGLYVLKFRGAGQGPKALVAELVVGELGRALGLRVPDLVFVELDPVLGRSEPDPEIQDLIKASGGLNLGVDYLPGSVTFDPLVTRPDPEFASAVVWLDALTTNVDRTARNTNMLVWHHNVWLIDHGAALFFHHGTSDFLPRARRPFPQIADHVLLPFADRLGEVDAPLAARLTPAAVRAVTGEIPDAWLEGDAERMREAYAEYLLARLEPPRSFVEEAESARARLV
jgi:hypothetical protein